MKAIVTMPPYAQFMDEVLEHPIVSGIRLNTVMPVKEPLEDVLRRLSGKTREHKKTLWIDLKGRQLRVDGYWVPPYTEVTVSHKLTVDCPTTAYFGDQPYTLVGVDGRKLIMQDGPRRVVGPGESVNIPESSLSIEGYLTDTDKAYVEAAKLVGEHDYMLSFVESKKDLQDLLDLDPEANIVAKIESRKGMSYVKKQWNGEAQLMAARGDLFIELNRPHYITRACEMLVQRDPNAIVASRLLESLVDTAVPSCPDLGDVDNLHRMGYKNFMFGDEVCLKRESIMSAINVLAAMGESYGS